MRPTTTRMAAIVPAVLDVVRTATGWQVSDGALVGGMDAPGDMGIVGITDGADAPGYSTTRQLTESLGRARYSEDFVVRIWLSSWRGDTDLAQRREDVTAALGRVEEALAEASPREGVWDTVEIGPDIDWVPVQSTAGAACAVAFTVTGTSLL